MKKASDLLYFIAGASVQQLKVCYDPCFIHKCINDEIHYVISDFDNIINKKYSLEKIVELLIKAEVINDRSNLEKLTIEHVTTLRDQKCFRPFIDKYESLKIRW